MAQDHVITFRATDHLKRQLAAAAAADFRSTSSLITRILTEWLQDRPNSLEPPANDEPARITYAIPRGRQRAQAKQEGQHPWQSVVEPWLDGRERVTVDEVIEGALKIDPEEAHAGQRKGVESVLLELGWTHLIERQQGEPERRVWLLNNPL